MVGVVWAAAALLAAAGLGKLFRPGPTVTAVQAAELPGATVLSARPAVRMLGMAELGIAGWVILGGGSTPAVLLTVSYLLLTLVAWRMLRLAPGQDCGCFGADDEPISVLHVAVNLTGALIGAAATFWSQPSVVDEFVNSPVGAVLTAVLAGLLAWLGYLLMTALPALLALRAKVAPAQ